jgi:uncharacterized protein with GYD domain
MGTFFMFGKYTPESIREMSVARTEQAIDVVQNLGGDIIAMHALLGEYDLLFCVRLPSLEDAMRASVELTRLTDITFKTSPAVTVETFDRMMSAKPEA